MKIIAHRGNLEGPNNLAENKPSQIDLCINNSFDVEIDLRRNKNLFYLGHDKPEYEVDIDWLSERSEFLWIHCKDLDAFTYLLPHKSNFNFFWHQKDDYSLTSKHIIWAYPGQTINANSVIVMPESFMDLTDLKEMEMYGVCSDYPKKIKKLL